MHFFLPSRGKHVIILLLLFGSIKPIYAQNITVRGKVTDNAGPLIGVSVKVAKATTGAVTDQSGNYALSASPTSTLVFTYIGYVTQQVPVNGRTTLNVKLAPQTQALTEVVVTGYSTQRRKDITGAVAVVNVAAATSIPTGSSSQLLQGQASGVNVISPGQPGGNSNILIRGVSSFGNSQPLIIVDGVQSDLNNINPTDIQSIQVLKDAGAASIYGVRGSNGVVVITTKKGAAGNVKITYDAYYGRTQPLQGNVWNSLNSQEQATLVQRVDPNNAIYRNGLPDFLWSNNVVGGGVAMAGDPAVNPSNYRFDPSNPNNNYQIAAVNKDRTDWFHEIFKDAPMTSHSLSISGASERSNFFFSANYLNQQGTLINTFLKRYSTRVNTEFKIKDRIRIGENAYVYYRRTPNYNNTINDQPTPLYNNQDEGNAISFSYRMQPIIPVYDMQGNYAGTRLGTGEIGNAENPVAIQDRLRNNRDNNWSMVGNVFAEVDILKNLTARTSFGGTVDNEYFSAFTFQPYEVREGFNNPNSYNENSWYNSNWTWTSTVSYNQTFDRHNLKVQVGTETYKEYGRQVGGSSQNFFSDDINYLVLSNGTSNVTNYSRINLNTKLFSLFSRVDYSFADKYLLGATIRRDGASRFGNEKYGYFPSVSLGWRITQEDFMKETTWLNDLKIRGSWGKMGNYTSATITNPFTLFNQSFSRSYYAINGANTGPLQGFYQSNIGNPETTWEEDAITNVGFDASLFDSRIDLSAEWYKKSIKGLLYQQPLPALVGAATVPFVNIGDIKNTGFDISAGYHGGRNTENLKYNIALNVTTYKNTVENLPGGFFDASNSRLGNLVRNAVGRPVGSFFGYQVERLFRDAADVTASPVQTDAAPGRFKYADVDGDNRITPADRTFFGNPNPDFTYGLNLSANFKQFDASMVLYGSQGNDVINYVRYWTDFYGSFIGGKSKDLLYNSWTPTNVNAKTPVAESGNTFSTSGTFNSYYLENGSFLKCRSFQLGYTIDPKVLTRVGVDRLRIYLQAANLFTITKYEGLDPELVPSTSNLTSGTQSAAFGIDYGNYPNNQRSFLIGVNLGF